MTHKDRAEIVRMIDAAFAKLRIDPIRVKLEVTEAMAKAAPHIVGAAAPEFYIPKVPD